MNDFDHPDPALAARIDALTRSIPPPHDLWRAIDARIAPQQRSRWTELSMAAGIAAMLTALLFHALGSGQSEPQWAAQQLEGAYQPLRVAAMQRYRSQADLLDPALRQTVEENLLIIDRALDEIRVALAVRPNDPALRQMLQWTYDQELAVIEAVAPNTTAIPHYRGVL
jgi:hypothetical protein